MKNCLNKFYECREIRAKILRKNNPALIRINELIEETEKYIANSVTRENHIINRKTNDNITYSSRSVDLKEKNFDSTTIDSTNNYKSNITFYSSRSDTDKNKDSLKKNLPKFIDFRGIINRTNYKKNRFL